MNLSSEEALPAGTYRLYAHIGSPYSMKIRALLRYRRIPHVVAGRLEDWAKAFGKVRVPVMPVLEYPDGSFHNDSTPLVYDLEKRHAARSVIPLREGDAFLAFLIEDLADEWLSKAMYAYRWAFPEHTPWTGRVIGYDQNFGGGADFLEKMGAVFEKRQVGRNALVGCTAENMPMLVRIADTVLDAMESLVVDRPFLFGTRPSIADFGLFGQLCQFTLDFAAIDHCRSRAPYTMRWTHHVHDLSGHDGRWREDGEALPAAVPALLRLAGSEHLPFLAANARALEEGADSLAIEAGGLRYSQAPSKYQQRCLAELRRAHSGLSTSARAEVDPLLDESGCLAVLTAR